MHELEARIPYLFHWMGIPPGLLMPFCVTIGCGVLVWLATRTRWTSGAPLAVTEPVTGTGPATPDGGEPNPMAPRVTPARHRSPLPSRWQVVIEMLVEEVHTMVENAVGAHHARELTPFFATMFLFVLASNLIGLIPGFRSPTSVFSDCIGLALITFTATHYLGFRQNGWGYLKHFAGEPIWMAPLFVPMHIIGELSRPMSLTLRLFGNIMGEDVVIMVLTAYLVPLLVPIPMLAMAIFTSVLQALVFSMLSSIYIAGALGGDEH